jgi:hypothetical protein
MQRRALIDCNFKTYDVVGGNPVSHARIEGFGYKQFIITLCQTSLLLCSSWPRELLPFARKTPLRVPSPCGLPLPTRTKA